MSRKTSPYDMLPVEVALEIVLKHSQTLPVVSLPLELAAGSVLAEDVFSSDPLPPFRASIMDGYALIADVRQNLRL